ncbi:MAG: hypothetical protein ACRDB0_05030, partial [Paraclostridium sp.]
NITPSEIIIEGKKEVIEGITSISTQPIKVEDLKGIDHIEAPLDLPKGIKVSDETVDIKIELNKDIITEMLIPKTNIEIRNKEEGIEVNLDKIPDDIKVTVTHSNKDIEIKESDITLYIDLLEASEEGNKYSLKYDTDLEFKSIKIEPEKVEIN